MLKGGCEWILERGVQQMHLEAQTTKQSTVEYTIRNGDILYKVRAQDYEITTQRAGPLQDYDST